jgi:hypothetical protein
MRLAIVVVAGVPCAARGDWKGKAAREAVEYLFRKGSKEAAAEGAEALTRRLAGAAARHGDDAFRAVRRVGPRALKLADDAGEHGARAMRVLAKHGDDGVWLVSRPRALGLLSRYGDDAAEQLIRHKGVAEPLLERFGGDALGALRNVGPRGGRRLAMMLDSGELARIGRTPELLGAIGKYGDGAMEFVWKHKGALAVSATLAAFLANPPAFIEGAEDITRTVAENAVRPVAAAAGEGARGGLRVFGWAAGAIAAVGLARWWLNRHRPLCSIRSVPGSGLHHEVESR